MRDDAARNVVLSSIFVYLGCGWNDYLYGGQGRMASVIRDASFLEFLIEIRTGLSNGLIRVPFLCTWNFCNR